LGAFGGEWWHEPGLGAAAGARAAEDVAGGRASEAHAQKGQARRRAAPGDPAAGSGGRSARDSDGRHPLTMGNAQSGGAGGPLNDAYFLFLAARDGNTDILGLFLTKNAAIVRKSYADGERNTAWHYAAGRGHGEALAAMTAAARAQPDAPALLPRLLNAANSRGQTALALACEAGHERCTAELIGAGADVWLADAAGRTPLHLAAFRGHRTCVKLLLTRAAQRDALAAADTEAMKRCGRAPAPPISPQPPRARRHRTLLHSSPRAAAAPPLAPRGPGASA